MATTRMKAPQVGVTSLIDIDGDTVEVVDGFALIPERMVADLEAAGWKQAPDSGETIARPTRPILGASYFDTTLGFPIWWNGTTWVTAAGADADASSPPA